MHTILFTINILLEQNKYIPLACALRAGAGAKVEENRCRVCVCVFVCCQCMCVCHECVWVCVTHVYIYIQIRRATHLLRSGDRPGCWGGPRSLFASKHSVTHSHKTHAQTMARTHALTHATSGGHACAKRRHIQNLFSRKSVKRLSSLRGAKFTHGTGTTPRRTEPTTSATQLALRDAPPPLPAALPATTSRDETTPAVRCLLSFIGIVTFLFSIHPHL